MQPTFHLDMLLSLPNNASTAMQAVGNEQVMHTFKRLCVTAWRASKALMSSRVRVAASLSVAHFAAFWRSSSKSAFSCSSCRLCSLQKKQLQLEVGLEVGLTYTVMCLFELCNDMDLSEQAA